MAILDRPIRIVHMSDFHITDGRTFCEDIFLKGAEIINNIDADLYIMTGDITDAGLRPEYKKAKEILKKFRKPIIYIIGNHDSRNVGEDLFKEYIGPAEEFINQNGISLITVDSTMPDLSDGKFGRIHLKDTIEKLHKIPKDNFKIIAFHHHLLPVPKTGRERNILVDAGDVLEVILNYNVDLILTGHRHSPNVYKIENTILSNAGSFSCRKIRAGFDHSFNIIDIKPNGEVITKIKSIESNEESIYMKKNQIKPKIYHTDDVLARIVHTADSHVTETSEFRPELLDLAIKRINHLQPDLLIHAGDLTNDGLPDSYNRASQYLDKIKCEKVIVPGPHDLLHFGSDLFEEIVGDLNPSFKLDNINIIGINSAQVDSQTGIIGRSGLKRLINKVNGNSNKYNIVVFHHHLVPIPHTREKDIIEDAGDVLRTLCDHQIDLVLTGHRHISYLAKVENTVILNAGTVSSRRIQTRYYNTFNIIDILKNGVINIREMSIGTGLQRFIGIYDLKNKDL